MRDIHPAYPETTISCACGNSVETRSTRGNFTVDVCGNCHPFYTGKQKLMDTAGRVDRFRKKFGDTQVSAKTSKPAPAQAAPSGGGKKEKKKQAAASAPAAESPEAVSTPEGATDEPKPN